MNSKVEFWVPRFGPEEKALLAEVVDSGFLNDGPMTARFERQMADLLGCKHVVATTSGTAAIFLALAAIGVGAGDEVIVPDVTFIATANAVSLTGAKPVLVDVNPHTLNIDPTSAGRAISAPAPKPSFLCTSVGAPPDMDALTNVASRHGLLIVEDAAEALLSKYHGKSLGTLGIAGCFSLSPIRPSPPARVASSATDDERLHVRLRELKDQGRPIRGTGGDDTHNSVGYNFKFTDMQAAVGLAQLRDMPRRTERMKSIYRGYRDGLRGCRTSP